MLRIHIIDSHSVGIPVFLAEVQGIGFMVLTFILLAWSETLDSCKSQVPQVFQD